MFLCPRRRIAPALAALLIAAAPGRVGSQHLGVFFDEEALHCQATIQSFGQQHVWVYAFAPPDSVLSGVLFRVVLPPDLVLVDGSLVYPRILRPDPRGSLTDGLDLRFGICVAGPRILLAEFDLEDRTFGDPRPNLHVDVRGAASLDSVEAREPRLRVCDPRDPLGEGRGLIEVISVDGVLNCTGACPCTTAVLARAWSAIKRLYRPR